MINKKPLIPIILIFSTMFTAVYSVQTAHAYAPLSMPKWRNSDIQNLTIYVDSSVLFSAAYAVLKAMDLWNSLGVVRFVRVYYPWEAKIYVTYSPEICGGRAIISANGPERYITSATVIIGDQSCAPDLNWYTAVAVHELGHSLGLDHSRGAASIMGEAWNKYRIPAPLYDDIIALWMLYGRGSPLTVTTTTNRGSYQEWFSNIAELAGYPYELNITSGTNNFVLKSKIVNFSTQWWSYMLCGYVNPRTVYRGAIGVWASLDATNQTGRVAIVEFSMSGGEYYIALTYTSSSTGQTVKKLFSSNIDVFSDAGFFVQLILYLDVNWNVRPLVVVYRGADIIAYQGLDNAPVLYYNPFFGQGYAYVGFAVWTDSASNPSSTYRFGPLWG